MNLVKQVAKIWRKLIFLPEELVPDSSLRKVIFVLIFGLAQVDPQLEGPHAFEAQDVSFKISPIFI